MKTLKHVLASLMFLLTSHMVLEAQTELSVFTGLHQGDVIIDGLNSSITLDTKAIGSGIIGARVSYGLDDKLSVVSGLSYAKKGFNISESTSVDIFGLGLPVGVKVETAMNTVQIPLQLKYSFGNEKFTGYVLGGPTMNIASSGQVKTFATAILDFGITTRDIDFSEDRFSRTSFGGELGIGGELAYGQGKFFGELAFQRDMTNFMYEDLIDAGLTHSGASFKIGYTLAL